ncbi:winged helix-turn-helix transcriptional regulator [Patescibacteria group bacterium]|nr:winged helix-turn-helix transcriptional regulator [Patescibacteria group bacterium]
MLKEDNLISYGKTIKLDSKDKKILELINNHARLSIAQISRKTGIQRDSVLYRIKKMEKQKVIRFFHTVLNPSILGYPIYTFVNFVLHNLTEEKERSFLGFLKAYPEVVYVAKTTGKWDFTINIAAKNLKHFDEVITKIRMKFSKIIKDYETASIIQEYKYDYMVGLV